MATKFDSAMQKLSEVDGFLLANLVDKDSGMSMASAGGGMDIDLDSAVGTGVVKSIENAINRLDLGDFIDDTLISLGTTYHLLRPLRSQDSVFIHLALDRSRSNLALARHALKGFEEELSTLFE